MTAEKGAARLSWWRWLGASIQDVRRNPRGLLRLALPWYAAAAVVLAQAWLLFGVSPFSGEAEGRGEFWWPALVQEILLGLSGAAIAVRMTRHAGLSEPLVVALRDYWRSVVRYGIRLVLVMTFASAVTVAAALIISGVAGIKALMLPADSPLVPIKQGVVVLLTVLVFTYLSGRLHLWLTAAALDRRDIDLKTAWMLGQGRAMALIVGIALFFLPALGLDLLVLRLISPESGLLVSLPAFALEAMVNLIFTACLAAYFARLFTSVVPAPSVAEAVDRRAPQPA